VEEVVSAFKKCGHDRTSENTTPKGECRTCRQAAQRTAIVSEKGRARRRRADQTYKNSGKERDALRRRLYGAEPGDVAALLDSQRDANGVARCPLCGGEVTEKDALDHAHGLHGADSHRGVAHRAQCNPALGRTDQDLYDRARRLSKYAGRRRQKLIKNECTKVRTNPWATR
jgi:hypothetical protein